MKENLVQKLDLLEAQLSRLRNDSENFTGRLSTTKYVVGKLPSDNLDETQLESQISETKQAITDRKIHHTITIVQRCAKNFKAIESLKLAKRIKKETDVRRKDNMGQELSIVRELDPQTVAAEYVKRVISKKIEGLLDGYQRRTLSSTESNVFGRLGKMLAVKEAMDGLVQALGQDHKVLTSSKTTRANVGVGVAGGSAVGAENFTGFADSEVNVDETRHTRDRDHENRERHESPEGPESPERHDDAQLDDIQVASNEEYESQDEDEGEDTFFERDGLAGLPALAAGYVSGSDDEDMSPEPSLTKERKNRRGQRARRKIWEMKYGAKANHVLKEKQEREVKQRRKEERKHLKEQKIQRKISQAKELATKPIHPSWEAQRKLKEAQTQVKFAGQKKKFV